MKAMMTKTCGGGGLGLGELLGSSSWANISVKNLCIALYDYIYVLHYMFAFIRTNYHRYLYCHLWGNFHSGAGKLDDVSYVASLRANDRPDSSVGYIEVGCLLLSFQNNSFMALVPIFQPFINLTTHENLRCLLGWGSWGLTRASGGPWKGWGAARAGGAIIWVAPRRVGGAKPDL